jgi:hypothetical protein
MKTKIVSLLLAFGLSINAASAGNSAKIGYASDFFYRGAQKAEESVQASVMLGHSFGSLNGSLHVCTNQAVDSGNDSYHMGAGVGTSFVDGLLSAYAGINHFEDAPGDSLAEVEIRVSVDAFLSPSVSVFRNLDDSLYTFEVSASHAIDLGFAELGLGASVGNTELTNSNDTTYYVVGSSLSRSIGAAEGTVSIDYVDADDLDREFVFSTALTFQF